MSCLVCFAGWMWAMGLMVRAAAGWCSKCTLRQVAAGSPALGSASGMALVTECSSGAVTLPAFLHLLKQQWAELGLTRRPLSEMELDFLARRAGFTEGLRPDQLPLPPGGLEAFMAWYAGHLEVIKALGPAIYCCRGCQLVAGFDVGRAEAVECLRLYGGGAFCLRLGSMPGYLVMSLVEGSTKGRGRIGHYLFSASRLRRAGLKNMLGGVPGSVRLVDVSTGRVYKRSILSKALAKAEPDGEPAAL